ncbi:MAG TPA: glycosyltransferase family 4 protein, partial [Bryobacteraceae bacterium]|nr:glycosyltransferase family 4 protein [Bryobacteraceae bacterium]
PMRILVAHNVPRGRNGGMNRIMGFIHDEIEAAGHSVEYFCAEDAACTGKLARFTYPLAVFRHAREARRAGKPYDVINVHEPAGAAVAALKRQTGARIVVTSHGLESRGWQLKIADGGVPVKSRVAYPATVLWQARLALKRADHIFCLNSEDAGVLAASGISKNRITRIFPAADPIFGLANHDYRKADTILFAATWLPRKGIHELVSAFARVAATRPEVRLVVLNPGVADAEVLSYFPTELWKRVSCVRAAPERGVAEVFAAADIYLLPSTFEGTPLTLMEAMWSGLPIVATDTCGMHDVLRHGDNGLLIPIRAPERLAQELMRLLDDPDLREQLGRRARADAIQHYTWWKSSQPVRQAYENLVGIR